MKPVIRTRTLDLAVSALRDEILAGQWSGQLPGTRILAKRLGISPPTVAAALEQLAADGLLVKPGERKAYQVAATRGQSPGKSRTRRLLILTPEEPSALIETSRKILEALRVRMLGKGWLVDSQVVDYLHVKHPQRSWDRIIQVDQDTWVIALYGRRPLAEWSIRRKVRMFFLGGTPGDLPMPMVGVKSSRLLELALSRLMELGHWKVLIPLCDRSETFKEAMRDVTRRAVEGKGHNYLASYHNPESDYLTPDVTGRIIESAFAVDPPTALVFLDWKELVTAYCVLSKLKLSVPNDVSLVLLNDQTEAGWFLPELCRFRFPERRIVNTMVAWLEGRSKLGETAQVSLLADFIEGGTMTPPKVRS